MTILAYRSVLVYITIIMHRSTLVPTRIYQPIVGSQPILITASITYTNLCYYLIVNISNAFSL